MNFKFNTNTWLKAGYIQPSGNTLLKVQQSLVSGTYRGVEIGTKIDFGSYGALSTSYMWADQYKAPWYKKMYDFQYGSKSKYYKISYLHSLGIKYDFKNNFVVEAAFGQSHKYMNQYFAKFSYKQMILNHPLLMNYQFYGTHDQNHTSDKAYDGLAQMHIISLKYIIGPITLQTTGKIVQADGKQGYFLKRMTPTRDSSEGRFDAWWDLRSNFNANGERIIFVKLDYNFADLSTKLQGLSSSASVAYGWNAKSSSKQAYDQHVRLKELAWSIGLNYTFYKGKAEGTTLQLRYTNYNNNSKYLSNKGGFGNIFQDEHEIKFVVVIPFTLFSGMKK